MVWVTVTSGFTQFSNPIKTFRWGYNSIIET